MTECHMDNEVCGFSCTGADFSKVWAELHGPLLAKIDCESCHDHADELFKFIHDVVNLGLGKPVFDKKNFAKIYKQIKCVAAHVKDHELE